jgi:hypothetical protein
MKQREFKINLTEKIKARLLEEEGFEEITSEESWAAEKNKGKKLNKPFRTPGGPKKFSVYVKNEKGNIVKVNFGDPNMEIKRDDPARRKSFRARHNCSKKKDKTKAGYWSCKMWTKKSVTKITKGSDAEKHYFESKEEAIKDAKKLGLKGFHTHKTEDGKTLYMAGPDHETFMKKHKEIMKNKAGYKPYKKKK